jgi:hypothetical protein
VSARTLGIRCCVCGYLYGQTSKRAHLSYKKHLTQDSGLKFAGRPNGNDKLCVVKWEIVSKITTMDRDKSNKRRQNSMQACV